MHKEVRLFVQGVTWKFPSYFPGAQVLEFGARNINGDVRDFFDHDCHVTGVDCVPGPNVDHICLCHEFMPEMLYDVVFSTETLEHDPHWKATLDCMYRFTRQGGLIFFTCATEGRGEHGTIGRPYHTGRAEGPDPGYYKNLTEADIRTVYREAMFESHDFQVQAGRLPGLYFWGIVSDE